MAIWQFWTLIGVVVWLGCMIYGRVDKLVSLFEVLLMDKRAQHQDTEATLLRLPDDMTFELRQIREDIEKLRKRYAPTDRELDNRYG
jgi:hypothetical protein